MKTKKIQLNKSKKSKISSQIELAPLIDVICFIVIYFLMNATLENSSSIKVNLPKSSSSASQSKGEEIVISIKKEGKVFLNNEEVRLDDLGTKLKSSPDIGNKKKVIIRGDAGTDYQFIVNVIDKVHSVGITKFHLSMSKVQGN